MQIDPIKPTLKPPGTKRFRERPRFRVYEEAPGFRPGSRVSKRFQLKYDDVLSNFAFKFNVRRYTVMLMRLRYTLLSDTINLGRAVQVDPMNPTMKVPGTKLLKLKHDKQLSILLQCCFQF